MARKAMVNVGTPPFIKIGDPVRGADPVVHVKAEDGLWHRTFLYTRAEAARMIRFYRHRRGLVSLTWH
jgi:hypothetical protein